MNASTDLAVANTILAQLGGPKFLAMTGARNVYGEAFALHFRLPRGAKSGINAVRIDLDPTLDTYAIRFMKIGNARTMFRVTTISELEGVDAGDLRRIFTNATGLETSLGTLGAAPVPATRIVWQVAKEPSEGAPTAIASFPLEDDAIAFSLDSNANDSAARFGVMRFSVMRSISVAGRVAV